jgi:SAM-dependent methyltransferase
MTSIPARLSWAVDQLDPQPADYVLEIGGGSGAAAGLIIERLASGSLIGIDRSAAAVARMQERNAEAVAAGKVRFLHTAVAEADFQEWVFDRALAVNVNLFWQRPEKELRVLERILKPGGLLCLVYQPPDPARVESIAETCRRNLAAHGFSNLETRFTEFGREVGVAVLARTVQIA